MITELVQYITPDGDTINLNSPPYRSVEKMTGWGRPPMTMRSIRSAYQHGESPVSYRLDPRRIKMSLHYRGCNRSEWFDNRGKLLARLGNNLTSPNLPEMGTLRWEYIQDGAMVQRDLDCYLSEGLEFNNEIQWFQWGIVEQLEFVALNPIIYDPTQVTETITTFTDSLILPMTFPFILGGEYASSTITYTGTWITYPIIEIDGPAENITIENSTLGTEINFDYNIPAGVTVTIDTSFGNKSVIDSLGNDLIAYLVETDLAGFALEPSPIVTDGENVINVYVVGSTVDTEVRFKYYTRYYGI